MKMQITSLTRTFHHNPDAQRTVPIKKRLVLRYTAQALVVCKCQLNLQLTHTSSFFFTLLRSISMTSILDDLSSDGTFYSQAALAPGTCLDEMGLPSLCTILCHPEPRKDQLMYLPFSESAWSTGNHGQYVRR